MNKMRLLFILCWIGVAWFGPGLVEGAVINVTTTSDNVPGSLRAAITQANDNIGNDTIIIPAGTYILTGSDGDDDNLTGDLDLKKIGKLIIQGAGVTKTIIDANKVDHVFQVLMGDITFSNVTIKGGWGDGIFFDDFDEKAVPPKVIVEHCALQYNSGAGIWGRVNNFMTEKIIVKDCIISNNGHGVFFESCDFMISNCTIEKNGPVRYGGGVTISLSSGEITNCTITDNHGDVGAGVFVELDFPNVVELVNCTISGNSSKNGNGGGINVWAFFFGRIFITDCTIYGNLAARGGGLASDLSGATSERGLYIKNSIVAGNTTTSEAGDIYGSFNSEGNNLFGAIAKSAIWDETILETDIVGTPENPIDPMLAPLADNGGPTKTHALLWGSPAIDAGYSPDISTDQRGFMRPVDTPGVVNKADGSDIGAYEAGASLQISGAVSYHDHPLKGVLLSFSNNGGTAETDENGEYSHAVPWNWSGTVTPNLPGFTFSPASKSYTDVNSILTNQDYIADSSVPPRLACNRTSLHFGADKAGNESDSQPITFSNDGGGILYWTATCSESWLSCTPDSGTGDMVAQVSVNTSGMSPGTYNGTLTFEDLYADNSPLSIPITLTIYQFGSVHFPFGYVDAPESGSVVSGSIPVTGWALDNIGIRRVSVFREPVEGEENELAFIDDATFIAGARPDVETQFPGYPDNFKAGWGYMLLTNFLPSHGNGPMVLHIIAEDMEGNTVELGKRTIICDNANAVKPFGAIDTPAAGSTISGSQYVNFGWALTPAPNTIPFDGSTINVYLDGMPLGHPVYNRYRQDIATLFPGYNNSDGAVGYFFLDTTAYENGVHTIAWSVTDDAGNTEGIGSRYFSIQNLNSSSSINSAKKLHGSVQSLPISSKPIQIIHGYPTVSNQYRVLLANDELSRVNVSQLGRLEIKISGVVSGFLFVGERLKPLPPGSILNVDESAFYWHPGAACMGNYRMIFIIRDKSGQLSKKTVDVTVTPGS